MNVAEVKASIVADLVERHGCHAVVLYGSRAKGTANEASDWDVLGVRHAGPSLHDARALGDIYLDAFVETDDSLTTFEAGHLRYLDGEILHDPDGITSELFARLKVAQARGPEKLSSEARRQKIEWLKRTLIRAEGGSAASDYRRTWLLFELLPAYFELRSIFYLGPKESLAWLEDEDREASHLFSIALQPGAEQADLSRLVAFVTHVRASESSS